MEMEQETVYESQNLATKLFNEDSNSTDFDVNKENKNSKTR